VLRGTASELAQRYADRPPKGEVALVVGGPPERPDEPTPAELDALDALVEAGAKPRAAARVIADLTGGNANAIYRGRRR
jgi:16S rRNA (cytidine1402-2'-O)-methyltransferase